MTLQDAIGREAGSLEMPVDIAGEDEIAQRTTLAPAADDLKSGMRHGGAVKVQAVAEKAPCLLGIAMEPDGVRDFFETPAAESRVRPPKTLGPAEIGQAGIDAHARPGADQQGIGSEDGRAACR